MTVNPCHPPYSDHSAVTSRRKPVGRSSKLWQAYLAGVATLSLGALAGGCSDERPNQQGSFPYSSEQVREDYSKIPSGFILRLGPELASDGCSESMDFGAHALLDESAANSPDMRMLYSDLSAVNANNVARVFNANAYRMNGSLGTMNLLSSEMSSSSELKMLNSPSRQFLALQQESSSYPAQFSLSLQLPLGGSEVSNPSILDDSSAEFNLAHDLNNGESINLFHLIPGQGVSQVVHQGPAQGVIKGAQAPSKASVAQQGSLQTPSGTDVSQGVSQELKQHPNQHKGTPVITKEDLAVSQNVEDVHQGVQQAPPVKGTPVQGNLAKGTKGSTIGSLAGTATYASSGAAHCPVGHSDESLYHRHFLNDFRPIYESQTLAGYNWGYYGAPSRIDGDDGSTYYLYPRPQCTEASWCQG